MTHKSMSDPKVLKAPVGVLGKDLRDPDVTKLCSLLYKLLVLSMA